MTSPTLLQLHLRELHRRYMTVHHRGMAALSVGDVEAFGDAIRLERDMIEESRSAWNNYGEHGLNRHRRALEALKAHAADSTRVTHGP